MRINMLMGLVLMGALVANRTNAQQDSMKPKVTQTAAGDVSLPLRQLATRILGVYFDTDNERDSVEVFDLLAEKSYILYRDRVFPLNALASQNDSVAFAVRKIGFVEQRMIATIAPADTTPITIVLEKSTSSIQLPAMVTTAKVMVSAAEERAKSFDGKVLTIDDLAPEFQNLPIGKVLERKGMTPEFTVTHRANKGFKNAGGGDCKPRILLNGDETAGSLLDLNNDPTSSFTAVEFYPTAARAPKQFLKNWSTSCGVIIFWSTKPR